MSKKDTTSIKLNSIAFNSTRNPEEYIMDCSLESLRVMQNDNDIILKVIDIEEDANMLEYQSRN